MAGEGRPSSGGADEYRIEFAVGDTPMTEAFAREVGAQGGSQAFVARLLHRAEIHGNDLSAAEDLRTGFLPGGTAPQTASDTAERPAHRSGLSAPAVRVLIRLRRSQTLAGGVAYLAIVVAMSFALFGNEDSVGTSLVLGAICLLTVMVALAFVAGLRSNESEAPAHQQAESRGLRTRFQIPSTWRGLLLWVLSVVLAIGIAAGPSLFSREDAVIDVTSQVRIDPVSGSNSTTYLLTIDRPVEGRREFALGLAIRSRNNVPIDCVATSRIIVTPILDGVAQPRVLVNGFDPRVAIELHEATTAVARLDVEAPAGCDLDLAIRAAELVG